MRANAAAQARVRQVATPRAIPIEALYAVQVGAIWSFLRRQQVAFWFLCFYLLIEYVRPQTVWPILDVLPYAQLSMLLCLGCIVLERTMPRLSGAGDFGMILFTLVLLTSSAFAYSPAQSRSHFIFYFCWVITYVMITTLVMTEERFVVFMLSFLLYSFKMSQHGTKSWAEEGFQFRDWGTTGAPGYFQNSGEFGIQMTIFLPISIAFILALRSYWGKWKYAFFLLMPITAVTSIIASSSRGALLGLAAVTLWMVMKSRHKVRALPVVAVLAVVVWLALPNEQKSRLSESGEDQTSNSRIMYWKRGLKMMDEYPVLGIGYGNWLTYYNERYGRERLANTYNQKVRGELPHNIFIEAGAEMGYAGLGAFVFLIGATLVMNAQTRRMVGRPEKGKRIFIFEMAHGLDAAMIGFLVSGFFVTVLYYPFFWVNLSFTVALNRIARAKRALASGGPTMRGGPPRRPRMIIAPMPTGRELVGISSPGPHLPALTVDPIRSWR